MVPDVGSVGVALEGERLAGDEVDQVVVECRSRAIVPRTTHPPGLFWTVPSTDQVSVNAWTQSHDSIRSRVVGRLAGGGGDHDRARARAGGHLEREGARRDDVRRPWWRRSGARCAGRGSRDRSPVPKTSPCRRPGRRTGRRPAPLPGDPRGTGRDDEQVWAARRPDCESTWTITSSAIGRDVVRRDPLGRPIAAATCGPESSSVSTVMGSAGLRRTRRNGSKYGVIVFVCPVMEYVAEVEDVRLGDELLVGLEVDDEVPGLGEEERARGSTAALR